MSVVVCAMLMRFSVAALNQLEKDEVSVPEPTFGEATAGSLVYCIVNGIVSLAMRSTDPVTGTMSFGWQTLTVAMPAGLFIMALVYRFTLSITFRRSLTMALISHALIALVVAATVGVLIATGIRL